MLLFWTLSDRYTRELNRDSSDGKTVYWLLARCHRLTAEMNEWLSDRESGNGPSVKCTSMRGLAGVRITPNSRHLLRHRETTRMGWTGRAPAPTSSQSTRGLCQEKEHHHASHVHGSRSDRYRNRYGQEHPSHGRPGFARWRHMQCSNRTGLLRYVLPNFRQQFTRAVGLGHKVVAASRPCLLFFPTRRKRGDRDDRDR